MTFLEAVRRVVEGWGDKRITSSGGVELLSHGEWAATVCENGSVARPGDKSKAARQAFDEALAQNLQKD